MIQKSLIQKNGFTAEDAIKFLESKGYVVIPPKKNSKIISKTDIIEFFYKNLGEKVTKGTILASQMNDKSDREAIDSFQEKAKSFGMSQYEANKYLMEALGLFFRYYGELGLTQDVVNLWFVLNKGSWILSKAEQIHLRKLSEYEDSDAVKQWKEEIYMSTEGIEKYINKKVFDIEEKDGKTNG